MVKGRACSEHPARPPPGLPPAPTLSLGLAPSWVPPLPLLLVQMLSSCYSWAHSLLKPSEGGEGSGRVSSHCWLNKAETHSRRETFSHWPGVHSQAGTS